MNETAGWNWPEKVTICEVGLRDGLQNEQKILKALLNLKIENDLIEKIQNLKEKSNISVVLSIFEKYFKLILPYYNFLENKDLRDKIIYLLLLF